MTTERDELRIKLLGLGGTISSCWPERGGTFDQQKAEHAVDETADAILAAGYRKPQQVTTVEELDALPVGALLLSCSQYPRYAGTVWRVISGRAVEQVGREAKGVTPIGYFKDPLPATVLHVGGAE